MNYLPTERLRRTSRFMRAVAAIVALTFSALILAPSAAAARQYYADYQKYAIHAPGDEARLSRTIVEIERLFAEMEAELEQGGSAAKQRSQVQQLRADVAEDRKSVV